MSKLWGGRFVGNTDPVMNMFNKSVNYDKIMWEEDILGSLQYSTALLECGLLTKEEVVKIHEGLSIIKEEWRSGEFVIHESDEDIHTANERRLTELVGKVGGKLHTGRSRNDQVVTDLRLWLRNRSNELFQLLSRIITSGIEIAEVNVDVLQAGYTHMQPAQIIRFSHWLLSHIIPLLRDVERLIQMIPRINVCPLGSGAIAGHSFGINRSILSNSLGFKGTSLNSLDATSDRDFVAEFLQWASLLMVHLSQFSEDMIFLNNQNCVEFSDAYCTGSSLMPQKKNPDALELMRGKCGRVLGNMTGFMCTLKALPRAYNKDLQEDKEPLFDTVHTVISCLEIYHGILSSLKPNKRKLHEKLTMDMLATDLAEYLVRKGVPFRETHHVVGEAVKIAESTNLTVDQLTLTTLQQLHPLFAEDVQHVWDFENSAESRNSVEEHPNRGFLNRSN